MIIVSQRKRPGVNITKRIQKRAIFKISQFQKYCEDTNFNSRKRNEINF